MTLLVFGYSGQVATELRRQANDRVTALSRDQADLSDPDACVAAIRAHRPRAVINAAAYTAVDQAETQEPLATTINGTTPGAMAQACADLGVPFLHISTDYVFDGTGTAPWAPDAPTAPINAYGRSKLAGEQAVRDSGAAHVILRTAWVFSAHGANFVKTMLRLGASRDHLTVVADQHGGPTPAADIAACLLHLAQAMADGAPGGTYHLAGHPATTWAGFARAIMAGAGLPCDIRDIPSSAYPTPAARPANSVLDCTTLARDFGCASPDWRPGLRAVLAELAG